jgi:hypothetical protein
LLNNIIGKNIMNPDSGEKEINKISKLAIIFLKVIRFLIFNLILVAGAVSGGILGALKAVDSDYSKPALNKIIDSGYFVCGEENEVEGLDFILENCESDTYSKIEMFFKDWHENTSTLSDSGNALISTINQLDLPSLPEVSEIPEYQGLLDVLALSQNLEPFSIWNIREYGEIANQFINYFSENGQDLISFLTSDIFSEVQTFVDSTQHAYLALEQGLGYLNILSSMKMPLESIGVGALKGMGIGMLVLGAAAWGLYKLTEFGIKKTKNIIVRKLQEKQYLKNEQLRFQDLSRIDNEFEKMAEKSNENEPLDS